MGKKPSVSHLRVFGCRAYAHVPKDERGKLDCKTKKCVLVGYGEETKAYRLYDTNKKVIFSRDVLFNENECGIECDVAQSEGDQQYFDLDLSDEADTTSCPETTNNPLPEPAPVEPVPEQQTVRRSGREKWFPDYYGVRIYLSQTDPNTVKEVLSTPEKD